MTTLNCDQSLNIIDAKVSKTRRSFFQILFDIIIPLLLVGVLFTRLHLHYLGAGDIRSLSTKAFSTLTLVENRSLTIFALFAIWLEYISVLSVLIIALHKVKMVKRIICFFNLPILVINLINLNRIVELFTKGYNQKLFLIFFCLEIGLTFILTIKHIVDYILLKEKLKIKTILLMLVVFLCMMIPTLPTFFLQMTFGGVKKVLDIRNLSFIHRVYLYLAFLIPAAIYFLLRNKEKEVIDFSLLFMSCGVLVGFMINYNYLTFTEPWGLPLHLCNTALYIIPVCLIFKLKKFFYFTYFINVIGALFAMMMPNYGSVNIIATETIRFWYNHWMAFFMPFLIVGLKVFPRPKMKEFAYSMIAFAGYFLIVLFLNVLNTAFNHPTDYFFINGSFITDKLGQIGKKIFAFSFSFTINGKELVFRPVYQIIFLLVYVALGLAELFFYNEMYKVADSHKALNTKLHLIKANHLHFNTLLTDEDRQRIKDDNMETKLVLNHVYKKYGNSLDYSVKDASLEVEGGEIFGFLGPNGAGKSTIIKAIVGIHPVTDGTITVCGYDVTNQPVLAKYHIGYVPDHYALYEKLTGREYINYIADIFEVSKEERDERLEKYIHLFELENAIDNKIATYSHGMKQKITIMSALVHNPKVWILDEPLTGLDPNSIYQVKQCMKLHASEGNIVFFSSHLIDIVEKLCQKIAIIKKGEIQVVKSVEEIEKEMPLEEFYMQTIGKEGMENE